MIVTKNLWLSFLPCRVRCPELLADVRAGSHTRSHGHASDRSAKTKSRNSKKKHERSKNVVESLKVVNHISDFMIVLRFVFGILFCMLPVQLGIVVSCGNWHAAFHVKGYLESTEALR